ncbi:MAG TPA: helicase-related protein [Candidatus Cybelea sp.]|nr:helicase-related protein [Candidatus Cybelea sp.]
MLAVLGPTNTGKTHLAVERLLAHKSGIIGLPLRLLAREIYDRVVTIKGPRLVALVTGEEKIIPPSPAWYICTVESMPLERGFDFVAVDEVQLVADAERGHVFTERLLYARGGHETLFLGAETVRGLIRRLVPEAEFVQRARLSQLSYAGPKKLSRLPRRSAIVAFSAQDVYAIAELVRRQRGGAAVVLGALSPRTRNAQVAMYQNREVDFLVATDAIGMGLNMDVDHVAFAGLRKFDGRAPRNLSPAEVGQIAGRAGRHMNNGTFGTTADLGALDADLVERVENHHFDVVAQARWRNVSLDFSSPAELIRSLDRPPPLDCLLRARDADDYLALRTLALDPEIAPLARGRPRVKLLWDVCQIPDFRKTMHDAHTKLLGQIYRYLTSEAGVLPAEWVARHVAVLDRTDGDIDTLAQRIAHTRTWTYVSHRVDWLDDARAWQERARAIEDRLSDALHERLTQRFVDRRTSVLVQKLKDSPLLSTSLGPDGEVMVEGQYVGQLRGLSFRPDSASAGAEGRALRAAAHRGLGIELGRRAAQLSGANDGDISLGDDGRIWWQDAPLARLVGGETALKPRIRLIAGDQLDAAARERVQKRLETWLAQHIARWLGPLEKLSGADMSGPARGLAFQLGEGLGVAARRDVAPQIAVLTAMDRARLRQLGVRIGETSVFLPALLKPAPTRLACILWAVRRDFPPILPPPGRVSIKADASMPAAYWQVAGFLRFGDIALRIDMAERIAAKAAVLAKAAPFAVTPELLSLAGCTRDELTSILHGLGYRSETAEDGIRFARKPKQKRGPRRKVDADRARRAAKRAADSPFAALKRLDRR